VAGRERAEVEPATVARAVAAEESYALDLAAVLAGAGLERVSVTPELARTFGRILRVVVSGVMDVLRARQQIKDEFRMRMTQFRPSDNNPLKFSANVDDALHNLLVKRNPAYLAPVEAFEDAFEDLRNHQIAMLAGMRVAFEAMLAHFDPDRLQEQFDRQLKGGSLLNLPAKLRYWDLYRDRRQELVKDPETSFRKLFGEEFARAYEEQLELLKSGRGAAPGATGTHRRPGV
jgi:type VI secretion system FHA domain protein